MHTLKSFLAIVGTVVLALGATVVTIAALWGKDRRHRRHDNDNDAGDSSQ